MFVFHPRSNENEIVRPEIKRTVSVIRRSRRTYHRNCNKAILTETTMWSKSVIFAASLCLLTVSDFQLQSASAAQDAT